MVHKELSLTKNIKFYCLYKYIQVLVFLAIKVPNWMIVVSQYFLLDFFLSFSLIVVEPNFYIVLARK